MNYLTIGEKKVPVIADIDVLVAGGGCAGVGAAIASARNGAKTMLLERMFYLGGMMTGGLMSKIAISQTNHGLAEELLNRLDKYQKTTFLKSRPEVPIDPELTKSILDEMLTEEEVDIRFGSTVTDVIAENGTVKAVLFSGIEGTQAVRAKYFIDCTGDGMLGYLAGATFSSGDENGFSSSPTLMFRVANCNINTLVDFMEEHEEQFLSEQKHYTNHRLTPKQNRENLKTCMYAHFGDIIPFIRAKSKENPEMFSEWDMQVLTQRGLIFMNQPQPNHVLVNASRIPQFTGTSSKELSNAMITGRKQVETLFKFMKNFLPGFENSFVMDTGSLLGIRESRRITGDYIFTQNDVESLKKFEDGIVSNHGGIEIHSTKGVGTLINELPREAFYTVPYRSVIAKDFKNLFMAGRCFSASHPALSAARNIAYCMALGEVSGTAANMLIQEKKADVRDIDIKALRSKLTKIL